MTPPLPFQSADPSSSQDPAPESVESDTRAGDNTRSTQSEIDSKYAPLFYDLGPFKSTHKPPMTRGWAEGLPKNKPVICIVTTAPPELDAVKARLEPAIGEDGVLRVSVKGIPTFVGKLGKYQVCLLSTEMGNGPTKDALQQVLPGLPDVKVVIAVGFGYGVNPALKESPQEGQMIGDVMLSARCQDMSHYKENAGTLEPRADLTSLPSAVANAIGRPVREAWSEDLNWDSCDRPRPPIVHYGTYLSLPVLFNDAEKVQRFVDAVKHLKPIGGDMEVYQIIEAARVHEHMKAWLAIKSICDFGGLGREKKSDYGQPLAAATAADFARYLLSVPSLFDRILAAPATVAKADAREDQPSMSHGPQGGQNYTFNEKISGGQFVGVTHGNTNTIYNYK